MTLKDMIKSLDKLAEACLAEAIYLDTYTISRRPTAQLLREAGQAVLDYKQSFVGHKEKGKE